MNCLKKVESELILFDSDTTFDRLRVKDSSFDAELDSVNESVTDLARVRYDWI